MKRRVVLLLCTLILLVPNLIQNLYAQERKQGYQGYVEAGYTIGTTDWREANRIEISTSHGYQFRLISKIPIIRMFCSPLRMYVIRFNKHR